MDIIIGMEGEIKIKLGVVRDMGSGNFIIKIFYLTCTFAGYALYLSHSFPAIYIAIPCVRWEKMGGVGQCLKY